ncbi:DUF2187 family protein [Oceanobacillus massiliensis]|uniref:DUF2187 family protein n=1 Tax=Oceanobacillus massiliensis TaxID=1465765 RepID=UPI000287AB53|nr:DUF2187 family protein [Oceanobacillus massiliensis]
MAEEKEMEKKPAKNADVGDSIHVIKGEQKGKKGKVLTVRENSVIVKIGTHPVTGEPIKTVVNHKNYKREKSV